MSVIRLFRVWFYSALSDNKPLGNLRRIQPVQFVGRGVIRVEGEVSIGYFPSPLFFSTYAYLEARNSSASIVIGKDTWINNNFCAIAEHGKIEIGERCFIGYNVEVFDSDFHGLMLVDRKTSLKEWARPVSIGNDVFIGSNVKILKGVTVGNGAVIGNGTLLNIDVPANYIARGNPAELIKFIEQ